MLTLIKERALTYWFYASVAALAVLYILSDRQKRQIRELTAQAQRDKLSEQLKTIQAQAQRSDEDYAKSLSQYVDFKRRHGELLSKLGISHDFPVPGGAGAHPGSDTQS